MNWPQQLLEFLVGLLTGQALRAEGAEPIRGAAVTTALTSTGYTAPRPPAGAIESRDIADCTPYLQDRWPLIQAEFQALTGRQLFLTCTWRSAERQQKLYAQGRTMPGPIVTKIDGVTKRSRHGFYPSQAFDVCVDTDPGPGKHPVWDEAAYEPLGPICERHGLTWGGSWASFKDLPHIEQPAGLA